MNSKPDVTIVVNPHRERTLAYPTLRALSISLTHAAAAGLTTEVVAILDRSDEQTRDLFEREFALGGIIGATAAGARLMEVDNGDLALSRNDGAQAATADIVGMLDADNIVSREWIARAYAVIAASESLVVAHPDHLVTFEGRNTVWPLMSSTDERFCIDLMCELNYWDSFSMARKEVYLQVPYAATGPALGIGPEDWHWNAQVLQAGITHVTVPETVLFYRVKRSGSLLQAYGTVGTLLPRTELLSSRDVARLSRLRDSWAPSEEEDEEEDATPYSHSFDKRTQRLLRSVQRGKAATTPELRAVLSPTNTRRRSSRISRVSRRIMGRGAGSPFIAEHYRLRYPDIASFDDRAAGRHWSDYGKKEGRHGTLSAEDISALSPSSFNPDHYRLMNPDLGRISRAESIAHFLAYGPKEHRRLRLSRFEIEAIAPKNFNPDHYRLINPDLAHLSANAALVHFIQHGRGERRQGTMPPGDLATLPRDIDVWLEEAWRTAHEIDPLIAVPSKSTLAGYRWYGTNWHLEPHPFSAAYWKLIDAIPDQPDAVFIAPWVRMGGGDLVLSRYMQVVRRLVPEAKVVLITTEATTSTHLGMVPEGITVIDLGNLLLEAKVNSNEAARLLGTALMQTSPRMIHVINSGLGVDVIEKYSRAITRDSKIFLSSFVLERGPDGQILSWLTHRTPGFLDLVSGVLVDHQAIIDQYYSMYRFDKSKFAVHHQPATDSIVARETRKLTPRTPRILWTGRFDRQKRLDILAAIAERLTDRGVDAEIHFYGAAVVEDHDTEEYLERLEAAGAVRHPPFLEGFSSLGLENFDLFLMTSEWEGIPIVILEAMAAGLPVIAPAVGGIPEVLTADRGYPVSTFDAIDEYVDRIVELLADYDAAVTRAKEAQAHIGKSFSWEGFESSIKSTPGYLWPEVYDARASEGNREMRP